MRQRVALDARGRVFDVAYQVAGQGPPLLLIHGLGASSTSWHYQIARLAAAHRVVAIDLPGHGSAGLGREMPLLLRAMCLPGPDRLIELIGPALVRALRRIGPLRRRFAGAGGQQARCLLTNRLGELAVPVLVVWGSGDRVLPLVRGLRAAEAARGRLAWRSASPSPASPP